MKRSYTDTESSEVEDAVQDIHPLNYAKVHAMFGDILRLKAIKNLKAGADIVKTVENDPELRIKYADIIESPDFKEKLEPIKRLALLKHNMSLETLLICVNNYIADGNTVKRFAGYPKNAQRATDVFVNSNKKPGDGISELAVLRKAFTKLKSQDQYVEVAEQDKARFVAELKNFLEENEQVLLDSHVQYIRKRLSARSTPKSKPAAKRIQRKQPKSAFEVFCTVFGRDYVDIPEEKKNRKLTRRFNKLTDEERLVYERLAGEV